MSGWLLMTVPIPSRRSGWSSTLIILIVRDWGLLDDSLVLLSCCYSVFAGSLHRATTVAANAVRPASRFGKSDVGRDSQLQFGACPGTAP